MLFYVHVTYHILLACHFIVYLDSSLVKDGSVNLCAAGNKTDSRAVHEVLLVCFLQSCSVQSMDLMHYTKYSLYALHKS